MNTAPGMHSDKTKARALALAMHAAFIVLLIFGVSWQKKPESPVVADLWSALPPLAPPKVEVTPPVPEPPKPAPRVEPPPVPKAEPVPVPKPDIAVKKKEKEKEKKAEPKAEPKKREDDKAEKARKEAEARKAAEREQDKKLLEIEKAAEAKAAAEKAAAERARASEMQKYVVGIQSKVYARVALPADLQGNPEAEVVVSLLPGGDLRSVTMRKSSGNAAYDAAILQAIRQAQPFTVPSGDDFQRYFREFPMTFRPQR